MSNRFLFQDDFDRLDQAVKGNPAPANPLGYAQDIGKQDALQLLNDPRFVQDVIEFYGERDGTVFSSHEEAVERFFKDRAWKNYNSIGMASEWFGARRANTEQKQRLGRLQRVWEAHPNFYEDEGLGGSGLMMNAKAMALDPLNFVGFGWGARAAQGAAKGAQLAKRAAKEAGETYAGPTPLAAGAKAGAKYGAMAEAPLSGGLTAAFDYGTQRRDMEIGLRDEVDPMQVGIAGGLGTVAGGVLGAGFGALGAVTPMPIGGRIQPSGHGPAKMASSVRRGVQDADITFDEHMAREARQAAIKEADAVSTTVSPAETQERRAAWDNYQGDIERRTRSLLDDVSEAELASATTALNTGRATGIPELDQMASIAGAMRVLRAAPQRLQQMMEQVQKLQTVDPAAAEALARQAYELDALYERAAGHIERGEWSQAERVAAAMPEAQPPTPATPAAATPGAPAAAAAASPDQQAAPAGAVNEAAQPAATAPEAAQAAAVDEQAVAAATARRDEVQSRVEAEQEALTEIDAEIAALEPRAQEVLEGAEPPETFEADMSRLQELKAERAERQAKITQDEERLAQAEQELQQAQTRAETSEPVSPTEQVQTSTEQVASEPEAAAARARAVEQEQTFADDAEALTREAAEVVEDSAAPLVSPEVVDILRGQKEPWIAANSRNEPMLLRAIADLSEGLYGARPTTGSLKAQYHAWRLKHEAELRKGKTQRQFFESSRRAWALDVMRDMQASTDLAQFLGSTFVRDPLHSGALDRASMHAVLRIVGERSLFGRAGDELRPNQNKLLSDYHERLIRQYDAWHEQHAPDIIADAYLHAGEGADTLMRGQYGDDTVDFLSDLAAAAPGRQNIRLEDVTYLRDGLTPEQITVADKAVSTIISRMSDDGTDPAFIQLVVNRAIDMIRNGGARSPGEHIGRSVPGIAYGKYGENVSANTLGGVQAILRGTNRHGYTGRLMRGEVVMGEDGAPVRVHDAQEAAATQIDQAWVEGGTQRKVRDPLKAAENQDQIDAIDEALKAMQRPLGRAEKKLWRAIQEQGDENSWTPEMRQFADDIMPGVRETQSGGLIYTLADDDALKLYTQLVEEGRISGNLREASGEFKRGFRQASEQEISKKKSVDGQKLSRDPDTMKKLRKTKGDLKKAEKDYSGMFIGVSEAQPTTRPDGSPLQEGDFWVEKKAGAKPSIYSDSPEPPTEEVFKQVQRLVSLNNRARRLERDSYTVAVPEGFKGRLDTQGIRKLLQDERRLLSQSTDQEARGRAVELLSASDERALSRLWGERSALIGNRSQMGEGTLQYEGATSKIKEIEARIEEINPTYLVERREARRRRNMLKTVKQENPALSEAEALAEANARLAARGDGGITPKEADAVRAASDQENRATATKAEFQQKLQALFARRREDGNEDAFAKDMAALLDEFSAASVAAPRPTTKPVGAYTPMVVVKRGADGVSYEVDVRNHFSMRNVSDGAYDVVLTVGGEQQPVGRLTRLADGNFEVSSYASDSVSMVFGSMPAAQRGFVDVFDGILDMHARSGKFEPAKREAPGTYTEPDWKQTRTHENAPAEDVSNPPTKATGNAEDELDNLVSSYSLPSDRDFAIQFVDGDLKGVVRTVPRTRDSYGEMTIGRVLGRHKGDHYVVGTVEAGTTSNTAASRQQFAPLDPDAMYIPTTGQAVQRRHRFDGDPDVVTPEAQPVPLAKANEIEVTQAHIAQAFPDASPEVQARLTSQLGDLQKLHDQIVSMENVSWEQMLGSGPGALGRFDAFSAQLERLYHLESLVAPHGIKLPNGTRRAAMNQLAAMFGETRKPELAAVFNLLRGLGSDGTAMPRFRDAPNEGYNYTLARSDMDPEEQNAINIAVVADDVASAQPEFAKVTHELFHWAYFNILSPKERLQFWQAMREYVAEGGVAEGALKSRLPGSASNELASPAEFFANQGAMWALSQGKAGPPGPLADLWKKVASVIDTILARFFGLRNDKDPDFAGIDENLIPLFERIFPDEALQGLQYEALAARHSGTGAGGFIAKKLNDYAQLKTKIERAVRNEDEGEILAALLPDGSGNPNFVSEAYRLAGKRGHKFLPRRAGKGGGARVRLFDGGDAKGEVLRQSGMMGDFVSDPNGFFIRAKMLRTMYDIQREAVNRKGSRVGAAQATQAADEQARASELQRLMDTQDVGDEVGVPYADWAEVPEGMRVMDDMATTSGDDLTNLKLLANNAIETLDEAETQLRRAFNRAGGKIEGDGVRVTRGGVTEGTTESAATTVFKRRATARKRKQQQKNHQAAEEVLGNLEATLRGEGPQSVPAGERATVGKPPQELSVEALIASLRGQNKRSPEKQAMAAELLRRQLETPEIGGGPVRRNPKLEDKDDAAVFNSLVEALNSGRKNTATKMARELRAREFDPEQTFRVPGKQKVDFDPRESDMPILFPTEGRVAKALKTELEQNRGAIEANGIPPDAPAGIREALHRLTHRDKVSENMLRTFGYRMFNMMGRTEKDLVQSESSFLSVEDVYRLSGKEPPESARAAFAELASLDGDEFNAVRKDLRRFVIGLQKDKANPFDLMHEIGHMTVRATFTPQQRANIVNSYMEALTKGDPLALRVASRYGDANPGRTSEEWFVEGWAQYLGERVGRGDMFKVRAGEEPLRLRGSLDRMADQLIEFVAYLLNGMIRNKGVRQEFRRLTWFGDMQAGGRAKTPFKTAVDGTDNFAVSPALAANYARETVDSMPQWRKQMAAAFVGGDPSEDLMRYVYYHGTPNGGAFLRSRGYEPVLEPSDSGALFGPGIYIAQARGLAERYSESGHRAAVRRMVDGATDNEDLRRQGYEIGARLGDKTAEIAEMTHEMALTGHSTFTQRRAAKLEAEGQMGSLSYDDPVRGYLRQQKRLARLLREEQDLWRLLEQTTGARHQPSVLPLFVRATDSFDFRDSAVYHFNKGAGDISWLPKILHKMDALDAEGVETALRHRETMTGSELFELLTEDAMLRGGKASNSRDAKEQLQVAMRELGFDSYRVTESSFDGLQGHDALVVFDPSQVKHIDADVFDVDRAGIFQSSLGGDMSFTPGRMLLDMADQNRTPGRRDAASILRDIEQGGAPPTLQNLMRKMVRGENLNDNDLGVAKGYGPTSIIRENSDAFRHMGAHWFGDHIKPAKGGPSIFEKGHSDMAQVVQPIVTAIRSLPDSQSGIRRWLESSRFARRVIGGGMAGGAAGTAMMPGLGTFAGTMLGVAIGSMWGTRARLSQPASHRRIVDALRSGSVHIADLPPAERRVAIQINEAFKAELQHMREAGLVVGDATRAGYADTYLPNMWEADAIRQNPNQFMNAMTAWFQRESRNTPDRLPLNAQAARAEAEKMMNKIIDEDGFLAQSGYAPFDSSSSDPFHQRFIHLRPEDVPELGDFMTNDLEGIITKYFNRTARKRVMADEFGVGGHAYTAYKGVSDHGWNGAIDALSGQFSTTQTRFDTTGVADVENLMVPPISRDRDAVERALTEVDGILGQGRQSGLANKGKAVQHLLAMYDADDLTTAQFKQAQRRVEAVVSGLVDFRDHGSSVSLRHRMDQMWDVLNQRSADGSNSTSLLHQTSRFLRMFNSTTLLGFATLTSLPDLALPLIRSGNLGAWARGLKQWSTEPEYRALIRNTGVGIENLIHDRMMHMAGDGSQRFTNSFFHAQGLTPWTNMTREAAGLVGFNSLKAEMEIARKYALKGQLNTTRYRTAKRFLERYGLSGEGASRQGGIDFASVDAPRMDDLKTWSETPQLRYALLRFTNEAVFVPDPNDVPIWGQTPVGALIFQLKSFPLMAGRLSGYAVRETGKGNLKPLMYMGTVGVGFGMAAMATKDVVQHRGGEDHVDPQLRVRQTGDTAVGQALQAFNILEDDDLKPTDQNDALGWYFAGLFALGGLGLVGEMMAETAAHSDNATFGFNRVLGMVAGPTYDTAYTGWRVAAGSRAAIFDDPDESVSARRSGLRAMASRVPVLGGARGFREIVADAGGEPGRRPSGPGFSTGGFGSSFQTGDF